MKRVRLRAHEAEETLGEERHGPTEASKTNKPLRYGDALSLSGHLTMIDVWYVVRVEP